VAPEERAINCRVVTPEATVLDEDVEAVVVQVFDGELGILRNHAPLVALVGLGELRARSGGETRRLAIDGGFLQVKNNRVTVLTTRAVSAALLDPEAVEAQARELGTEPPAGPEDRAAWQHKLAWNKLCRRLVSLSADDGY
jgi:F-type H+-transporting ATPase subunit epsilon